MKTIILSIGIIFSTNACAITSEPRPVCIESHTEIQMQPFVMMINNTVTTQFRPIPVTVCDVYFTPTLIPTGEQ